MPNNKTAAIRQEQPSDYKIIHKVVKKAFESAEHSDGNEQELVIMLRKSEAYIPELSLVAEIDSSIVGHIMFTRAKVGDESVLALAPLSVLPEYQRKGYGTAMIRFLEERYRGQYGILQVGTGDSPLTVPFYEACGFRRSHTVKNFFTEQYDHPIYEAGVLLKDMVYLRKKMDVG